MSSFNIEQARSIPVEGLYLSRTENLTGRAGIAVQGEHICTAPPEPEPPTTYPYNFVTTVSSPAAVYISNPT
jgi:hypothetical protein